ncbi:MAG: NAD(P)H-hydrate dehydratase [Polyangiaceae bacterium]|nr:NAD(P)H-hydrate dehydratase [Polyangiaceae bacterium]
MIPVLSRAQIRALDQRAIEVCHVPGIVLMENAGRGAADAIERWLVERRPAGLAGLRVVIAAGRGNNGGDGCVVARHLALRGARPILVLTAERSELRGDAAVACAALAGTGGSIVEQATPEALQTALASADLAVDALFGTGLDRDLSASSAALVSALAAAPVPVIALDLPSGIDADTGAVRGFAVRAALTVTFGHPKPGLYASTALERVGQLVVADIGIPSALSRDVGVTAELTEVADVAKLLGRRPTSAHKGMAGRVLLCAGARGTMGAALLCAQGALRAGAGLVTIAADPDVAEALDRRVLEAMTAPINPASLSTALADLTAQAQAVGVGPGLGRSEQSARIVIELVKHFPGPLVIDADAITLLGRDLALLEGAPGPRLLTPHPGELARILGGSPREIEADRFTAVIRAVERTSAMVLLKGPRTIIGAPGALPVVNPTGNAALATGGSGDVLTGIITAFACQLPLRQAAIAGAYLHGLAADRWVERTGADRGLLAHEIADELPAARAAVAATPRPMPD